MLLGETIASFLLTRAAWEPARVVARVDPGIRAALCAAETATRPLAERLGGAAPFADLKPGAMFILADDDEEEEEVPGSRGAACTVLASHLPHDVTARLAAYVSRAPTGSSGRHARWVWTTTRGDDDGRLERRGLVVAREASVAACLMLRPLRDEAAAVGDEDRYFAIFPGDAVFLGTDATERWSGDEFRAFAMPYFQRASAWTYVPFERHVTIAPGGALAWFDEALDNAGYGECRGTGVLVRRGDAWVLQQYNLTVPVPNDLMAGFAKRIRAHLDGAGR